MKEKPAKPMPHPDDFVTVTICLAFQAKLNPDTDDPPPLGAAEIEDTFRAADAIDYLEKLISAIRERRLYGLMLQEQAESAVVTGQWIEKTLEEVFAEATAENVRARLPNLQRIKVRQND
jgi:hypothetical protein